METTGTTVKIVAMPKIVGKVDLSKYEKKEKKLNYKQYGSFSSDLYNKAFKLALEASKKIGVKNAITVSKTSKIKVNKPGGKFAYEEVANMSSIWYDCKPSDLKKYFMTPLYMLEVAAKHGVRKYTKAEFLHLPVGKEFFLMYVTDKGKIEIIKNVRVDGGKKENEGVWYHSASDAKKLQYCLRHEDLNDDSTFKTGVDGEIGYIYITEGENA